MITAVTNSLVVVVLAVATVACASYSPDEALLGIYWSNAVKCSHEKVMQWDCGAACTRGGRIENITLEWDDSLEVRAFVGYQPERNWIVWSFRGSVTTLNWIEDFDFSLVNYTSACGPSCRVHQGFLTTYSVLAKTLLPRYKALSLAYPSATTFITGHSLGAAQSEFALLDVLAWLGNGTNVKLYNYGAPRTGNPAFASWAQSQLTDSGAAYYRVVHNHDLVPMLPPPVLGYQQFPRDFIWYSPELPAPGYVLCDATGVQMDETTRATKCGASSLFAGNGTDHVYYLGIHMDCSLK